MRLIIALVLVLAGIALIFFGAKPLWAEASALRIEHQKINSTLSNLISLRTTRDDLLQAYNSVKKIDLDKLHKIVPSTPDNASLLVYLEKTSSDRGIRLRQAEFEKEPISQQKTIQATSLNYNVLPISFTVSASYDSFKSFLSALERSARVMDVTDISFNVSKTNLFEFTIKTKTYYSKGQPAIKDLQGLKNISIDTSFFGDPQFVELDTAPVPIPTTGEGRVNPFLPF